MKILVLCEGAAEKATINLLLDNNKLAFTRNDLIGLGPYQARQLSNPTVKSELKIYNEEVIIYRVGDVQKDRLKIPNDLRHMVFEKNIFKYATKPEYEILLLLNENKLEAFRKSGIKNMGDFAKSNIVYNKHKYDKSEKFINEYYAQRIDMLVANIKEYKKIKKHKIGELYLADLIK